MVLADQAIEDRLPPDGADVSEVGDRRRDRGFDSGRSLTAGLMWTIIVIVLGVFGKDLGQMPLVEDQHPVEHLTAERSDNPLTDRIRPWSVRRGFDDPEAVGSEDLVEGRGELGVPVTDQEPQRIHPGAQPMARFRACWATHVPVGLAVMPATCSLRVPCSMNTSTYRRLSVTVSTVKKSHAMIPWAWADRNCRHVGPDLRGAGPIPAVCKISHTVEGAT